MDIDQVPAYIVAVPPDRTIHLPADVPVGASVAVVLVSSGASSTKQTDEDEEERGRRFERTLAAVRAAEQRVAGGPEVDEATPNALIDRARRA